MHCSIHVWQVWCEGMCCNDMVSRIMRHILTVVQCTLAYSTLKWKDDISLHIQVCNYCTCLLMQRWSCRLRNDNIAQLNYAGIRNMKRHQHMVLLLHLQHGREPGARAYAHTYTYDCMYMYNLTDLRICAWHVYACVRCICRHHIWYAQRGWERERESGICARMSLRRVHAVRSKTGTT